MSIRVDKSRSQEKWSHGQPSWDHRHHLRKHQTRSMDKDNQEANDQPLTMYNSRGHLVVVSAPARPTVESDNASPTPGPGTEG